MILVLARHVTMAETAIMMIELIKPKRKARE